MSTFRLLALVALLFFPSAAQADDLIASRAWFEDNTGQMRLPEARGAAFTPFKGLVTLGYADRVFWARLTTMARVPASPDWGQSVNILRIRPNFLDDVQVFDTLRPDAPVAVIGDHTHPRFDAFRTLDLAVPIDHPEIARDLYLRVKTTSSRMVFADLIDEADYVAQSQRQNTVFTILVSLIFAFLVWGLVQFATSGDPLFGVFALKQAGAVFLCTAILGQMRLFWPDWAPVEWLDAATSFGSCLSVGLGILFELVFLSGFGISRWARGVLIGFLLLFPIDLGLVWFDRVSTAMFINALQVLLAPIAVLAIAISARGWRDDAPTRPPLPRAVVIGYYVLLFVLTLMTAAPGLAIAAGEEWLLYVSMAHYLLTGALMFAMLSYRRAILRRRGEQLSAELAASQQRVEIERAQRADKEKLISVLSHELNTPLSVVRMLAVIGPQ